LHVVPIWQQVCVRTVATISSGAAMGSGAAISRSRAPHAAAPMPRARSGGGGCRGAARRDSYQHFRVLHRCGGGCPLSLAVAALDGAGASRIALRLADAREMALRMRMRAHADIYKAPSARERERGPCGCGALSSPETGEGT
jgi:hypothetical protein